MPGISYFIRRKVLFTSLLISYGVWTSTYYVATSLRYDQENDSITNDIHFINHVISVVDIDTKKHEKIVPKSDSSINRNQVNQQNYDGGLIWHNLQVSTSMHFNTGMHLLQSTSGSIQNGKLTGLLGPSGSGKSTLLSVLAGRMALHVNGILGGYIIRSTNDTSTNTKISNMDVTIQSIPSKQVAWLQQHDDFFVQLTVRETLELAAFFELPHISKQNRSALVHQVCTQLGLQHAMQRPIGDHTSSSVSQFPFLNIQLPHWLVGKKTHSQQYKKRANTGGGRLSGGERRRLSVALELLTDKQIIIADEPTSGLDSAYSVVVMKLLQDLAKVRNIPAICSLHQPRSSIWTSFDSVILLAPGGRVCYAGSRIDVIPYFHSIGYTLPDQTNPAEFLIDLVSIDPDDVEVGILDEARINNLTILFRKHQQELWTKTADSRNKGMSLNVSIASADSIEFGINQSFVTSRKLPILRWISRFGALWRRSWRQNIRDVQMNVLRLLISIGNAALLTGVFPTVRGPIPYINSIADRVALLSFGAINLCMMAYMKAITLFAHERPVLERERIREQYSVFEYLLAKVFAEFPIDILYSIVFSTVLKKCSGLQISLKRLTSVFSLLTTAAASLGYFLGSVAPSYQYATTSGIPVLVILMVVGVVNPSGVDKTATQLPILQFLKKISPFYHAIEALCLGEYCGVRFVTGNGAGLFSRLKNAPRMGGLAMISSGDEVIKALGMEGQTFHNAMTNLAFISIGNLVLSWIGLVWKESWQRNKNENYKAKRHVVPHSSQSTLQNQEISTRVPMRVKL